MAVHAELLDDDRGREVLTVIAKLTWSVSATGEATILVPGAPVRQMDVWRGEPYASSLRYPSDLWPEKPGTDLLLLGTARPPADRAVTALDVVLRVATARGVVQKSARVHGPRVYYPGLTGVVPGPAGRLGPTPLVYELTHGGADRSDPAKPSIDERNPIGLGFVRDQGRLVGTPAPSIEEAEQPLGSRHPAPVGFGPIPPHWAPRCHFAGTYDDAWRRERAPLPPVDRAPRYASCASPGLWVEEPLRGDELIEVTGATPVGLWRFRLPFYHPVFSYRMRGDVRACPTHLDTLLVDADAGQVELTFRTSIPAPRRMQAIEIVRVEGRTGLSQEVIAAALARGVDANEDEDEDA